MIRTNVYLRPEQLEVLKQITLEQGIPGAEIIRRAIDAGLEKYPKRGRAQ